MFTSPVPGGWKELFLPNSNEDSSSFFCYDLQRERPHCVHHAFAQTRREFNAV